MSAAIGIRSRVQEFLREQRNLGFHLVSCGRELLNFASFVEDSKHQGAVTQELTCALGTRCPRRKRQHGDIGQTAAELAPIFAVAAAI